MAPPIDVRSADIVLVYTADDERGAAGAPPHDLSSNDIGRLAYRRAMDALGDTIGRPLDPEDPDGGVIARPDPERPDPELVDAILAELLESGRYAPVPPLTEGPASKTRGRTGETTEAGPAAAPTTPTTETAAAAETPEA